MALLRLGAGQTGSIKTESFGAYGFNGGLNVKAVPQFVDDNELIVAYNGYLRADGGFQMRNGMTLRDTVAASGACLGLARFYQEIINGVIQTPGLKKLLAQINGNLYIADTQTLIGSIGSGANPMTWVRAQDPNDPNFVSGLTDVIVLCTGVNGPYVYDGTNLYTPAGWSAASGASWCTLVNGVIWFGGIPATPNQIFGTGTGQSGDASMETLPAQRNFVFSGPVMGLSALGTGATAALVVGLNEGISVLSGTGYSNYYLQDIPMSDGVTAGRTMQFYNGVMYWLGHNAVWAFDGQDPPQRISDKIEPWILNDAFIPGYPITTNNGLTPWIEIYNNKLHLGYCSGTGITVPNTVLVFDLVVGGWTVLQTSPGLYCMALLDAPGDPNPSAPVVGSSTSAVVYNWDVEPVAGSDATDAGTTIITQFQTKYFKLGLPGTTKMLLRAYPELFLSGPLAATFIVSTDYGNNAYSNIVGVNYTSGSLWDVADWDVGLWGSGQAFNPYGFPLSRIDYQVEAESFSFGLTTVGSSAPWIFQGFTGSYSQKAAT
jgi:hypothetical protein